MVGCNCRGPAQMFPGAAGPPGPLQSPGLAASFSVPPPVSISAGRLPAAPHGQLFLQLTKTTRVIWSEYFSHVNGAAVYEREGWKFSEQ